MNETESSIGHKKYHSAAGALEKHVFCFDFVLKTFFVGRELNWQYLTKDERYKSPTLKVSIKTCFVLSAAEFFVFISLRCFQEKQVEPVL